MKSLGIKVDKNESLLLALENISQKTDHIIRKDSYYYLVISFTDIPYEDRNVYISSNDWFQKSTMTPEYLDSIISDLDEDDGIMEEPVRDFLALLQEVYLEFLEIKIFEID